MAETRAAVKQRLQEELRWEDAKAFRDGRKAAGVAPAEAWRQMVAAFPPLTSATQPTPAAGAESDESPAPRKRRRRGKVGRLDLRADVAWAYANMGEDPDALLAPSAGARELLKLAKSDPREFLKSFVAKLMPKDGGGGKGSKGGSGRWNDDPEISGQEDSALQLLQDWMRRNGYDKESTPEEQAGRAPPPPLVVPEQVALTPAPPPRVETPPHHCPNCETYGYDPKCAMCHYIKHTTGTTPVRSCA